MNWEAVAALGQVVGAFAVVLTFAYLAAQIRQNTRGMRRGATADAIAAFREWNYHLIVDSSVRQVFIRGAGGLDNLSNDDERAQFIAFIFNFFKTAELLHFQYTNGAMDEGVWEGWKHLLSAYGTTTGSQQFFQERRQLFSPRFQEWLDNQGPSTGYIPLSQTFDPSGANMSEQVIPPVP